MGRHPNNKVWEYFDYISDKTAKCRSCKAKLSTPKRSRGNMVRHLFTLHGINTYTAGQKRGMILEHIPSKRGREFDESIREGEHNIFRRFKDGVSIDSNTRDIEYTESNVPQVDDDSQYDYHDMSNNGSHHGNIEILKKLELSTLKIPPIKVGCEPQELHKQDKGHDGNDINDQDDEVNMSLNDPLINFNVESPGSNTACNTSDISKHYQNNPQPYSPSLHHLTQQSCSTSDTQNYLGKFKTEALTEKLKAEARYFNELANLTRSKRILVDLQCQKLRNQIRNSNLK